MLMYAFGIWELGCTWEKKIKNIGKENKTHTHTFFSSVLGSVLDAFYQIPVQFCAWKKVSMLYFFFFFYGTEIHCTGVNYAIRTYITYFLCVFNGEKKKKLCDACGVNGPNPVLNIPR